MPEYVSNGGNWTIKGRAPKPEPAPEPKPEPKPEPPVFKPEHPVPELKKPKPKAASRTAPRKRKGK